MNSELGFEFLIKFYIDFSGLNIVSIHFRFSVVEIIKNPNSGNLRYKQTSNILWELGQPNSDLVGLTKSLVERNLIFGQANQKSLFVCLNPQKSLESPSKFLWLYILCEIFRGIQIFLQN